MGDRIRLFVTGVAAVGVIGTSYALPSIWSLFSDEAAQHEVVPLSALRDFDAIAIRGPDDVVVTRGDHFDVSIDGEAGAPDHLDLRVRKNVLVVGRRGPGRWNGSATVHVTMPDLVRVNITGSSDLEVDTVDVPHFAALVEGSGHIRIAALRADRVDLSLNGSGSIELAGEAGAVIVRSAGSGDLALGGLTAKTADIRLEGSGTVEAQAHERANLVVAGSGTAQVQGTNVCQITKSGSGEAECTS